MIGSPFKTLVTDLLDGQDSNPDRIIGINTASPERQEIAMSDVGQRLG
jgi:hypothetical protein